MRCHFEASPYSRLAILESVSPATTVYVFSTSATLGAACAGAADLSAGGAVDDPPATTSEKSAFFFSASLSLSKMLSSRPIVYLAEFRRAQTPARTVPFGMPPASNAQFTRTDAVPNFPSDVAVIVTVPLRIPRTTAD